MPTRQGSFRIFKLLGIDVYLHWSWFLIALWDIQGHSQEYNSYVWNVLEILSLFLIILLHEFGHALACRQVGGTANQIVLWPLGGVAYVSPPQRPGAMLWSIAAGPLVNVALFPILSGIFALAHYTGWQQEFPNFYRFIVTIWFSNTVILIFNLLPIYPLDGGQIFRSLLWFPFGRANSLMVAAALGLVGVLGLGVAAYFSESWWMGIVTFYIGLNCWNGLKQAQSLLRLEKSPRRTEFHCPLCRESPPIGEFWRCYKCGAAFDTFATAASCPRCRTEYTVVACPYCFQTRPLPEWREVIQNVEMEK